MGYTRDDIPNLYKEGHSLNAIARLTDVSYPTVRRDLIKAGVNILSRKEGIARHPDWNGSHRGMQRPPMALETKERMKAAARARWDAVGFVGTRIDDQGYVRFTAGEHEGRQFHVVLMEARLGRRLLPDENVHHIDDDKTNNSEDNLALVTKSGHARLHRHQERLSGKVLEKDPKTGRFISSNGEE